MLVLTRKLQEKIHVGDDITITVVRIKGNTVRVGIEAPSQVRVVRGEILQKDRQAAGSSPEPVSGEAVGEAEADDASPVLALPPLRGRVPCRPRLDKPRCTAAHIAAVAVSG